MTDKDTRERVIALMRGTEEALWTERLRETFRRRHETATRFGSTPEARSAINSIAREGVRTAVLMVRLKRAVDREAP